MADPAAPYNERAAHDKMMADMMANPTRLKLAQEVTDAWQCLDTPENFFDHVPLPAHYDFSAEQGGVLYCRSCVEVAFFLQGDQFPFISIKGSGQIRIPNGVSVRVFRGKDGAAVCR